jgi:glyoxylase-like metal-dependent hydrolase (beta-lactamase superfamily II)
MTSISIHPLHVGTITRPITNFCPWLEPKVTDFPLICWYIEGSDKRILVDTGGEDPSKAHHRWQPYRREKDQSIESALKKVGVRCEDIDIVIITHLHWDHSGSNDLFPRAKIIVQEEELETARSPFPSTTHAYIRRVIDNVDYTVISGDKEVARGVNVLLTPGHTYGLQGVLVEGEKRRIFIAGDTLPLFANFEQDPPGISNIFVDLRKYYESLDKIARLSAFILPGHDPRVFERKVYD